jgi:hypothetical protein
VDDAYCLIGANGRRLQSISPKEDLTAIVATEPIAEACRIKK